MALNQYTERPPVPALRGVVACTWTRVTTPSAEDESVDVDVVPDACMDIMWRSDGVLSVAGPDTAPYHVQHKGQAEYVGIRFVPGAAPALLGVAACELRDQRVDLADVWGKSAVESIADDLAAAPGEAELILQRALVQRLPNAPPPDPLIQALVRKLGGAQAAVAAAAEELGLSDRHLRRRCEIAVGYGPKTLVRVLRFQRFRGLADRGGASLAQLAIEAGYADQAHLNREYLRLAGTTPGRARA